MDVEDLDFPKYDAFREAALFGFSVQKSGEEIKAVVDNPIVRVQYKLSSKRKQILTDSEDEFEESVTSNMLKASMSKNLKMRSMVSQTIKDASPRNRFQDEEQMTSETYPLDLEIAGLTNVLKFKEDKFKAMLVDPFELTANELEELEKQNRYDGKNRTLKEELFLPIKDSSKELLIWQNLETNQLLINKKNQKLILDELERNMGKKVSFKLGPSVDLITIIEDMFIQKLKSSDSPLILFDTELN